MRRVLPGQGRRLGDADERESVTLVIGTAPDRERIPCALSMRPLVPEERDDRGHRPTAGQVHLQLELCRSFSPDPSPDGLALGLGRGGCSSSSN